MVDDGGAWPRQVHACSLAQRSGSRHTCPRCVAAPLRRPAQESGELDQEDTDNDPFQGTARSTVVQNQPHDEVGQERSACRGVGQGGRPVCTGCMAGVAWRLNLAVRGAGLCSQEVALSESESFAGADEPPAVPRGEQQHPLRLCMHKATCACPGKAGARGEPYVQHASSTCARRRHARACRACIPSPHHVAIYRLCRHVTDRVPRYGRRPCPASQVQIARGLRRRR